MGESRSRWTLASLKKSCRFFQHLSVPGVWRRLKAWKIRLKRGRQHITSPDPYYQQKVAVIEQAKMELRNRSRVLLYSDEVTLYRQPPVGKAYHEQGAGGRHQPRAELSHRSNTKCRIAGTLDAVTGRVLSIQGSKIGVRALCQFLEQIRNAYRYRHVSLVWDNWPIHRHPKVLEKAQELRIHLLFLPTYAPWLNPIEKLWRKLKEEIICMHRYSDRWIELKERIRTYLLSFDRPAPDLLRYVGLRLPF